MAYVHIDVIPEEDPAFEGCGKCVHCDDSADICTLRRCVHAIGRLQECYKPKETGKEMKKYTEGFKAAKAIYERRKGEWIHWTDDRNDYMKCSECGWGEEGEVSFGDETKFCPNCGADMNEKEDE